MSLWSIVLNLGRITLISGSIQNIHPFVHVNSSLGGFSKSEGDKILTSAETFCHFCAELQVSRIEIKTEVSKLVSSPNIVICLAKINTVGRI